MYPLARNSSGELTMLLVSASNEFDPSKHFIPLKDGTVLISESLYRKNPNLKNYRTVFSNNIPRQDISNFPKPRTYQIFSDSAWLKVTALLQERGVKVVPFQSEQKKFEEELKDENSDVARFELGLKLFYKWVEGDRTDLQQLVKTMDLLQGIVADPSTLPENRAKAADFLETVKMIYDAIQLHAKSFQSDDLIDDEVITFLEGIMAAQLGGFELDLNFRSPIASIRLASALNSAKRPVQAMKYYRKAVAILELKDDRWTSVDDYSAAFILYKIWKTDTRNPDYRDTLEAHLKRLLADPMVGSDEKRNAKDGLEELRASRQDSDSEDTDTSSDSDVSPQNSPPKASPIVDLRVFERCSSWFASDRSDLNELREVIKELEEAKGSVNAAKELDRCKVALDFYSILPKVTQEGLSDQDRHTFADAVFQSEQKGYGFESVLRREHYSKVAYSMLMRDLHAESLHSYQKMIELEPKHENNAAIFSRIGACYMHLKQIDEAIENLLKSIALGGNDIHSRLNLAACHVCRGDFPNAIFVLEAALRKFSDDNAKLDQVRRRLIDTILKAFKKTKKTCYAEKAITLLTSTFGNDTKKFPDWAREIYSELELFKITPKGNQALQTDWAFLN
jgi:tetratricopeptide (TPR) repeat protein